MQFLLYLIALLCLISTSNAQYCQSMTCRVGCESYEWLCGRSSGCVWNTEDEDCQTSDGINDPECCLGDTTTTLEPTTATPTTPEPTTPEPTTPEPTTPEPTTPEPTTPEPTTPEPTTPEPTTPEPTTPEPTTPEPTTPEPTTPEPTTPEPTTPEPTTPEPTTQEPTTTTLEPTEDGSWPTPQPTLKSAMKWEMIHPNYEGGDGELLWHVYYGDYSNDERFDSFRADEKWDANEIRPIIRYENGQLFNDDATIVSGVHSTAPSSASYGMWILMLSIAVIVIFACWYRSSLVSKEEITGLLEENKVQYNL